ncbi:MAG: hypothetical protein BroJett021_49200 [Chloroflexota bacterium]|nr:hypothetical protein [Caldilinea sp.]GIK75932.1 MAG: hypothetical protein BroJett021_49200 [Chloroflexota bacterium]
MDNPTRPAKPVVPLTPVKGSWEDLLYRGQQLVATHNQEGSAILQNLIDRLAKMPDASLSAGNHRLRNILLEAIDSLAPYLLYHQRYDEALASVELAERFAQPENIGPWRRYRAMALVQSGAVDEGFALLREAVRGESPKLWQMYVIEAIQHGRLDLAEEGVNEAEHDVNRLSATSTDANRIQQLRAMLGYCKAQLAAAQNRLDEASAWMEYTLAQHKEYHENLASFYLRLIECDHFAEALKWAQRDQTHPMRSKFWQGYIRHHLGYAEEAERLWRQIAKTDLAEEENIDLLEYVLAHYYLGDREGIGLRITLDLMERSDHIPALHFYLAGLGWAIRGNDASAHTNFQQALARTQALAMGHKLHTLWWRLCADLIDGDALPQFAKYFDPPQPDAS